MGTTVRGILEEAVGLSPHRPAVCTPSEEITYADLLTLADTFASALAGIGVSSGDRVAMQMHNSVDAIGLLFGCATLGATLVPINTRSRGDEITHVLRDSEACALFTHDVGSAVVDLRDRLIEAGIVNHHGAADPEELPALRTVVDISPDAHSAFTSRSEFLDRAIGIETPDTSGAAPLVLLYTSGTTSKPKGCELGQGQLVAVSTAIGEMWPMRAGDTMWNPLPIFHVSGIVPLLATFQHVGTWLTMPHFTVRDALSLIATRKPTLLWPAFITIWQDILTHPEFNTEHFESVRSILCIGPKETLELIEQKLPAIPVVNCYGLTEATAVSFLPSSEDPAEVRLGYAGRPVNGLEVSIRCPETRAPLPDGERGVLWLRGPTVFGGYLNNDDKNLEAFDADGWFCTGDLGRMSAAGLFTYEGREKDMLKVGGENVAAAEVEAIVSTLPQVKLSAVVGIPDDRYGEVPIAFVELVPGATLTDREVIDFCAGKAAGYKVPRHVLFVEKWPMSATKIRKGELRDRALETLGRAPGLSVASGG